MNELARFLSASRRSTKATRPPGPKGAPIMGVMREFNRDQLGFIERETLEMIRICFTDEIETDFERMSHSNST